jgi:hypothetical protein
MKKNIFLFLFFILGYLSNAQNDFEINCIVTNYPKRFSSPSILAEKINKDFETENAKARAIYSWIAFNIRYDVKKSQNPPKRKVIKFKNEIERQEKEKRLLDKQINKTISSRKGICGDYALLYYRLATLVGLKCEINIGTAKTINYDIGKKRATVNHAWNSVEINGEWKLLDSTWGAGYVDEETNKFEPNYNLFYFATPEDLFFSKHFPKDGVWHNVVLDKKKFLEAPLFYSDYLNDSFEILEPKLGVLEVKKQSVILFKIKNLNSESKIQYSLRRVEEFGTIEKINKIDDLITFEIKIDKTIGKFLTLYIDGSGVATYKIIQK